MPDFKDTPRGYKQKGWSAFTRKTDPVKKPVGPVTPTTQADYMKREVFNIIEDQKRLTKELDSDKKFDEKYNRANIGAKGEEVGLEAIGGAAPNQAHKTILESLGGQMKSFSKKKNKKKSPLKQVDDDTDVMTPKEERKHRREVLKYNKNVSKPMNETQKRKIREQLSKMDPKDPEAKLLRKMLNLKKNK